MAMQPGHAGQSPMGPGPIPSQQMMHMQHQQQQQQMAQQQQQQQGMPPGSHPPGHPQGPPNSQGPSSMQMSEQSKDNISKAKFLVPQLKETLMVIYNTMKKYVLLLHIACWENYIQTIYISLCVTFSSFQ